jgi:Zn finger protein HypA/HybF involved in hydrogenase expression
MIPDIKSTVRTLVLPSTGKKVNYTAMGSSVERELGRIKNTYQDVFTDIAQRVSDDAEAKKLIAAEIKDMTRELVMALQPCFPDLNLETITEGDLEMIQVHLKKRCVDDQLDLNMKCPECGGSNRVTVDLNSVTCKDVEHERSIELDDGSKLVITHVPIIASISTISSESTEDQLEYDELVHCFKTLRLKAGRKFEDIDMMEMSYEDKVDWAFVRDNVKAEQREQILDFLEDEAPSLEPIELKVESCHNRLYNGRIVSIQDMNAITEEDANNRTLAVEEGREDFVPEISKVKRCGHSYSTKIYSLSEYMSFF